MDQSNGNGFAVDFFNRQNEFDYEFLVSGYPNEANMAMDLETFDQNLSSIKDEEFIQSNLEFEELNSLIDNEDLTDEMMPFVTHSLEEEIQIQQQNEDRSFLKMIDAEAFYRDFPQLIPRQQEAQPEPCFQQASKDVCGESEDIEEVPRYDEREQMVSTHFASHPINAEHLPLLVNLGPLTFDPNDPQGAPFYVQQIINSCYAPPCDKDYEGDNDGEGDDEDEDVGVAEGVRQTYVNVEDPYDEEFDSDLTDEDNSETVIEQLLDDKGRFFMKHSHKANAFGQDTASAAENCELRDKIYNEILAKARRCQNPTFHCTLPCAEGSDYCMRHVLRDATAPYTHCSFKFPHGKFCRNAIHAHGFSQFCRRHEAELHEKDYYLHSKPSTMESADTLLLQLQHHVDLSPPQVKQEPLDSDDEFIDVVDIGEPDPDIRRNIPPLEMVGAKILQDMQDVVVKLPVETEEVPIKANGDLADSEDDDVSEDEADKDPLRHAGIYTAEDLVQMTLRTTQRLNELYKEEMEYLERSYLKKRRIYLEECRKEQNLLCSPSMQPKETFEEQYAYKEYQAYTNYQRPRALEKLLYYRRCEKARREENEDLDDDYDGEGEEEEEEEGLDYMRPPALHPNHYVFRHMQHIYDEQTETDNEDTETETETDTETDTDFEMEGHFYEGQPLAEAFELEQAHQTDSEVDDEGLTTEGEEEEGDVDMEADIENNIGNDEAKVLAHVIEEMGLDSFNAAAAAADAFLNDYAQADAFDAAPFSFLPNDEPSPFHQQYCPNNGPFCHYFDLESNVSCGKEKLPCTNYCWDHIMEDPHQVLFRSCNNRNGSHLCKTPYIRGFDGFGGCSLHQRYPLKYERISSKNYKLTRKTLYRQEATNSTKLDEFIERKPGVGVQAFVEGFYELTLRQIVDDIVTNEVLQMSTANFKPRRIKEEPLEEGEILDNEENKHFVDDKEQVWADLQDFQAFDVNL